MPEKATIVEFTDDLSGELMERPGLQAALTLLRKEHVAFFVCLDPDRLARRLMHQLLVTDEIERAGCKLEFVQHDYQETAEGRLFYQLRGAIAEFEKAKILERTTRGQRGKIAAGGLPHLIRMYGYCFLKGASKQACAKDVLIPDPRESHWVQQIYRWCVDDEIGPGSMAERLNTMGVPTKTGKGLWQHTQVQRILRHPAYATGKLALRKKDHRGIAVARRLTKKQRNEKGINLSATPKPPDQWQYVEIQPLVDRTIWEAAQEVLNGFRVGGRATGGRDKLRPLSGLGRCGLCGGPLYYLTGTKIVCASRYRHYWIQGKEAGTCTLPSKPRQTVEQAVWGYVRQWLLNPELILEERRRLETHGVAGIHNDPESKRKERETVAQELTLREGELERLGMLFARGLWPSEKALPAIEEVNRQIRALRGRLDSLSAVEPTHVQNQPGPLVSLLAEPELLREVQVTLDTIAPDQQAKLIHLVVDHYVLNPTGRGQPPKVKVIPRV